MHIVKVTIFRIGLRNRGPSSDISIEGEVIIQPDDPTADPIRQHVPENIRVDSLSQATQDAVAQLMELCQARLESKYPPKL